MKKYSELLAERLGYITLSVLCLVYLPALFPSLSLCIDVTRNTHKHKGLFSLHLFRVAPNIPLVRNTLGLICSFHVQIANRR